MEMQRDDLDQAQTELVNVAKLEPQPNHASMEEGARARRQVSSDSLKLSELANQYLARPEPMADEKAAFNEFHRAFYDYQKLKLSTGKVKFSQLFQDFVSGYCQDKGIPVSSSQSLASRQSEFRSDVMLPPALVFLGIIAIAFIFNKVSPGPILAPNSHSTSTFLVIVLVACFVLPLVAWVKARIQAEEAWWETDVRQPSEQLRIERENRFQEAKKQLSAMTGSLRPLRELLRDDDIEPIGRSSEFLDLWLTATPLSSLSENWQRSYCTNCIRAIRARPTLFIGEGKDETPFFHWECPSCGDIDAARVTPGRLETVPALDALWHVREVEEGIKVNVLRESICNLNGPWFIQDDADERSVNAFIEVLAKRPQLESSRLGSVVPDRSLVLSENSRRLLEGMNLRLEIAESPPVSAWRSGSQTISWDVTA